MSQRETRLKEIIKENCKQIMELKASLVLAQRAVELAEKRHLEFATHGSKIVHSGYEEICHDCFVDRKIKEALSSHAIQRQIKIQEQMEKLYEAASEVSRILQCSTHLDKTEDPIKLLEDVLTHLDQLRSDK